MHLRGAAVLACAFWADEPQTCHGTDSRHAAFLEMGLCLKE